MFKALRKRMSSGITASMKASSEANPTTFSMSRTSSGSGPRCRAANRSGCTREEGAIAIETLTGDVRCLVVLLPDLLLVRGGIQQAFQLSLVLDLQLDHPARAVRLAVHRRGILLQGPVAFDHRTGDRAIQVRNSFDGLDGSEHGALGERGPRLRQVHIHDVSELALRIVGDADQHHRPVAGGFDVLVFRGIREVGRNVGHVRDPVWRVREIRGEGYQVLERFVNSSNTARAFCSRSSLDPSLSITYWDFPRFRSDVICAAIIASASVFERPRSRRRRARRTAGGASTRTIASKCAGSRASKRRGMSLITIRSPRSRASASSWARRRCTAGCTTLLSAASA